MAGIDQRMQQFIQAETERQRFQARICFQNKQTLMLEVRSFNLNLTGRFCFIFFKNVHIADTQTLIKLTTLLCSKRVQYSLTVWTIGHSVRSIIRGELVSTLRVLRSRDVGLESSVEICWEILASQPDVCYKYILGRLEMVTVYM